LTDAKDFILAPVRKKEEDAPGGTTDQELARMTKHGVTQREEEVSKECRITYS